MEEKLKVCPFCGEDMADIEHVHEYDGYTISCLNCDARIDVYISEKNAIDAWNERRG